MLKALVWKEWRQQQPLVLAALGIAAVFPAFLMAGTAVAAPNRGITDVVDMLPFTLAFTWPIFAAFAAASTIAADSADGSLRFLLSRPVSRARVWFVKVGTAIASFLLVVAGTVFIIYLFTFLTTSTRARLTRQVLVDIFEREAILYGGTLFALLFACCVYCSAFFKRPMAAALAGAATAGCIGFLVTTAWVSVIVLPFGMSAVGNAFFQRGATVGVPLSVLGVFAAALWVFLKNEEVGTRSRQRMFLPLLSVTLIVMLIGAVPATYAARSQMATIWTRMQADVRIVDGDVVLPERIAGGMSTRIIAMPADGGARRTLVSRNATLPMLSPDGEWLTYASFGGFFNAAMGDFELRAARLDGTEDHQVIGNISWEWAYWNVDALFAPDSSRLAYVLYGGVWIASIDGGDATFLDIAAADLFYWDAVGWSATVPDEFLYFHVNKWGNQRDMATTELRAIDVTTGEQRIVVTLEGEHRHYTRQPTAGWRHLPVWLPTGEGADLHLIDTAAGELIPVAENACGYWGFADNGGRFVYGLCSGSVRTADSRAEFRVLDLRTGADELFGVVENLRASGRTRVFLSPDGEWLLIHAARRVRSVSTIGISRSGEQRDLIEGLRPVGWLDNSRVLVKGDERLRLAGGNVLSHQQFNLIDLENHTNRIIYP